MSDNAFSYIGIFATEPVGDSIWGIDETLEVKPTSRDNRAVVTSKIQIKNQDDALVLTYVVKRMLAGDPEKAKSTS